MTHRLIQSSSLALVCIMGLITTRARKAMPRFSIRLSHSQRPQRQSTAEGTIDQVTRFRRIAAHRNIHLGQCTDPTDGKVKLVFCKDSPKHCPNTHKGQTAMLAFPPTWEPSGRDLRFNGIITELQTPFPTITDVQFADAIARFEMALRCRTLSPM